MVTMVILISMTDVRMVVAMRNIPMRTLMVALMRELETVAAGNVVVNGGDGGGADGFGCDDVGDGWGKLETEWGNWKLNGNMNERILYTSKYERKYPVHLQI